MPTNKEQANAILDAFLDVSFRKNNPSVSLRIVYPSTEDDGVAPTATYIFSGLSDVSLEQMHDAQGVYNSHESKNRITNIGMFFNPRGQGMEMSVDVTTYSDEDELPKEHTSVCHKCRLYGQHPSIAVYDCYALLICTLGMIRYYFTRLFRHGLVIAGIVFLVVIIDALILHLDHPTIYIPWRDQIACAASDVIDQLSDAMTWISSLFDFDAYGEGNVDPVPPRPGDCNPLFDNCFSGDVNPGACNPVTTDCSRFPEASWTHGDEL